ncbi:hypothetical protein ACQR07_26875 [Bradyrhizobium sp. HKCCYLS20291]
MSLSAAGWSVRAPARRVLRGCRKAIGPRPACQQQIGKMRFYRISIAGKKSQTGGATQASGELSQETPTEKL